MITLVVGTNFLRALVKDVTGSPLAGASVTATMKLTYGAVVPEINGVTMNPVSNQSTYNYEFVTPDTFNPVHGTLYETTISVVKTGQNRTRTFTTKVDGN